MKNLSEPIKDRADIEAVEEYLASYSKRNQFWKSITPSVYKSWLQYGLLNSCIEPKFLP